MDVLIAPGLKPESPQIIESIAQQLMAMPVEDKDELEEFLKAMNAFDAWTSEYLSRSKIATQTNTVDEEAQAIWNNATQNVMPRLYELEDELSRKLLESPAQSEIQETDFAPFLNQTTRRVEIFREANLELERQEQELMTEYDKISGAWQTHFRGTDYTRAQMTRFLASPERDTREEAWKALQQTTFDDADKLDTVWEGLFEVRTKIAQNADFENYRDYIFAKKNRDYSPQACFDYHAIVAEEVGPLIREINELTRQKLDLNTMRPWDATADPDGAEPLKPFEKAVELQDGVERMMRRLDPEFGDLFRKMRDWQDLDSRPNKSQGGFMASLPESQQTFIFTNVSGVHWDIVVMLHEAGHAFHYLNSLDKRPMVNTMVPMEFNEVASMAMELLHYDTLDEFYEPDQRKQAIHEHLRRIPSLLMRVAHGDAWQHEIYTKLHHTRAERHDMWASSYERFSAGLDWSGLNPDWLRKSWHSTLHFFVVPFYFIEYGFAQLGALQVAVNAESDPENALKMYKKALARGPQGTTAELFAEAGAEFVPSPARVRELMNWIRRGLEI